MVGIPIFMGGVFLICFAVPRGAVDTDVEDCATPERQERGLLSEGLGEGLSGPLRLGVWIFLQDSLEGCSRTPAAVQHVDGWWELVGDLVGEFAPQGVLICSGGVGEPERQGGEPRSLPSTDHRQIGIRVWSVLNEGVQGRLSNGEAMDSIRSSLLTCLLW